MVSRSRSASPAANVRVKPLPTDSRTSSSSTSSAVETTTAGDELVGRLTPLEPSRSLNWFEPYTMLILALIAAATRFWNIAEPRGIVFDELHFGKFVQWTLDSWFYFDIHPPLAKQTLAVLGWLWGYDHKKCDYEPPAGASRMYGDECEYWKLRAIVAAFSVGACVLMYPIARRFGASPAGAILASAFEIFSIMHNVEGRLVLLNSQLIFWLNACLFAGQCWFARANRGPMSIKERVAWSVGVGFLAGNAFSVKHTGLGTPAIVGVEGALGIFFLNQPLPFADLLLYVVTMMSTYAVYFAFHLGNVKHAHLTLHQEEEFMTKEYQALLPGSNSYDPSTIRTEGFWSTFYSVNRRMVVHSNAITQAHNWGTRPFDWLVNSRGVSYWGSTNGADGGEKTTTVYLFSNPAGVLIVLFSILLLGGLYSVQLRTKHYGKGKAMLDVFRAYWNPIVPSITFCLLGEGGEGGHFFLYYVLHVLTPSPPPPPSFLLSRLVVQPFTLCSSCTHLFCIPLHACVSIRTLDSRTNR